MIKYLISFCLFVFFAGCQPTKVPITSLPVPVENNTARMWDEGWISVSENRTVASSNTISLPFILSHAPDSLKQSDIPVLIMSGGPGNSSLHMANGVVNTLWGESRDVLVLEQRGTLHSNPTLDCPEVDSLRILAMESGLSGHALDSLKMLGVGLCHNRLLADGIDLNGYNTLESVEDIEALRAALNIDKLILYGMSYSCNLMSAYAHTYPERTHALILDSPLPHDANYDEEAYRNFDGTLKKVIHHYSGSLELYADWKDYISSIPDSVFQISIGSNNYLYTRNELIDVILFNMSSHASLSETINSVNNIIQGNHEGVADVINYYLEPTGQALGMRYSVWISEELPEQDEDIIDRQKQDYSWLRDYPVNDVSFVTSRIWSIESIYETRKWPSSAYQGPALILSGEFDPWTPPWYGSQMQTQLPNARQIIYPERTHLPGFTNRGFEDITNFINQLEKGESKE